MVGILKDRPERPTVFRLAAGVQIVATEDLPPESRDRLDQGEGRFALVRPGARSNALLVDEEIAALVEQFRQSGTIAEMLIRFSQERQRDPQEVLRESFPTLQLLVRQRFLVAADSALADRSESQALDAGDLLDDVLILRPLQRMEDVEVFQVRLTGERFGVLKIGCDGVLSATRRLAHEESMLRFLAGDPGPGVLGIGEREGRDYLLLEWRPGSAASVVADEKRLRGGAGAWRSLLETCCRILQTYSDLHRRGVIHGDVHPRNILIDRQGQITLLDFEDAVLSEPRIDPPRERAGVPIYFEPEYARAVLDGKQPPPASEAGEQYALAALVYELITGVPYLDFDLRWEALLEQIVEDPPSAFSDRGLPSWPAVEAVLMRALSKQPDDRFASVAAMAAALTAAEPSGQPRQSSLPPRCTELEELVRLIAKKAEPNGPWMASDDASSDRTSVNEGSAGVALALYRISCQREEDSLLELADAWIQGATGDVDQMDTSEDLVEASPFFGSAGVHLVDAMISARLDHPDRRAVALDKSHQGVNADACPMDLINGRSSGLLTLCALLDQGDRGAPVDRARLVEMGQEIVDVLWAELEASVPMGENVGYLGMAHGWAGFLYATLQWCRSTGTEPPADLERRLEELADQSLPVGRGLMWPWRLPLGDTRGPRFMPGWCNGSAGYVFLWSTAAKVLGQDSFLELAEGAAWNSWESAQREGSLCCGLVGRAYALLDLFQAKGETQWLDRAHDLARIAVREGVFESDGSEGLFKGQLGLALLAADLQRPDRAWFPFLGPEPGFG